MVEFIARKIDRLNKGIHSGVTSVRGGARWVARDWHWAGIVPPIGLLVGISQAENISQAAIQAWQVLNPVKPVERVIDQPQEQLVRVEPVNTPLAEPTPQGPPEPERKGGIGPNPPDDDQTIKDNSDSQDANAKDLAPLSLKVEPPQKLPDVINDQTAEYDSPGSKEIEKMIKESGGEFKLAMPKVIRKLSLQEVSITEKSKALAVMGDDQPTKSKYELPALTTGKIVGAYKGNLFSGIGVKGEDGKTWIYLFPSSGSLNFKDGDDPEEIGKILASFTYDPDDPKTKSFIKFLETQFPRVPKNALFLIAGRDNTPSISKDNILTSKSGKVITTP